MMSLAPSPVVVDTTVSKPVAHQFCPCQTLNEPGVTTAVCGRTLAVNGVPSKNMRCPDCLEVQGWFTCPICNRTLWSSS